MNRLIEVLEKTLQKKAIIDRKSAQPGDVPKTFADVTKAQEKIDYTPQVNIEQGIGKFTHSG